MRDNGFLPRELFVRLIGKVLAWSQDTTRSSARNWECAKNWMRVHFGSQQFQVTHHSDFNAIQVDLLDPGTPLAVLTRLTSIVDQLIAECCKCLYRMVLVEHGQGPVQGPVRATPPSGLRPMFVPLPAIRASVENQTPLFGSHNFKLGASEVRSLFEPWLVSTASLDHYDVFVSYRWNLHDSDFTSKLVDH
jgi:hypothetical protein